MGVTETKNNDNQLKWYLTKIILYAVRQHLNLAQENKRQETQ